MAFKRIATSHLGQLMQQTLLNAGINQYEFAKALNVSPDGLSNLIHGRRRFSDDMLGLISANPIFQHQQLTLAYLKALRACDDYTKEELALAYQHLSQQ
jgi:transcriptional regulator with XRE-family HTH domain